MSIFTGAYSTVSVTYASNGYSATNSVWNSYSSYATSEIYSGECKKAAYVANSGT
jgi:hypothetical protein